MFRYLIGAFGNDLSCFLFASGDEGEPAPRNEPMLPCLHWAICGGESGGSKARPMHPDWVRSLRDQCNAAAVPFVFKQWGEWWPISQTPDGWSDRHPRYAKRRMVLQLDGTDKGPYRFPAGAMTCFKVGKDISGRILDGRTWDELPEVSR